MNLECPRLSHHVLILLPPTSTSLAALAPIGGDEPQQSRCQPATPTDRYRADLPRRSHLVSAARPMRSALSLRDLGTGRRRPDLMSCVMAAQRSAHNCFAGAVRASVANKDIRLPEWASRRPALPPSGAPHCTNCGGSIHDKRECARLSRLLSVISGPSDPFAKRDPASNSTCGLPADSQTCRRSV